MLIVIWLSVFWIQNCQSISTDELLSVMDKLDIINPYVYMKKELGSQSMPLQTILAIKFTSQIYQAVLLMIRKNAITYKVSTYG